MKKITNLFFVFIAFSTFCVNAQDFSVSFESDEGFNLGEINGQNNWLSNPDVSSLINITDERSSDGDHALHLESDAEGPLPDGGITGTISPELEFDGEVSLTVDLWIASGDEETSSEFNLIAQSPSQEFLTSRVAFFNGDIFVLNTSASDPEQLEFNNVGSYEENQWFELKIDYDFPNETIEYYISDNLILSGDVYAATNIEQLLFLSSFNQTEIFIDNINLMTESMSVEQIADISFSVFPNPTSNQLNISGQGASEINQINIYNVAGKKVKAELNQNNSIDVSHLSSGIYMMNIETEKASKTIKFIKN